MLDPDTVPKADTSKDMCAAEKRLEWQSKKERALTGWSKPSRRMVRG